MVRRLTRRSPSGTGEILQEDVANPGGQAIPAHEEWVFPTTVPGIGLGDFLLNVTSIPMLSGGMSISAFEILPNGQVAVKVDNITTGPKMLPALSFRFFWIKAR